MAFFGKPHAYIGLDIGTSSLKVVELIDRKKSIAVATYAEANIPNLLLEPPNGDVEQGIAQLIKIILELLDKAGVAADNVVAALPSSIVFSTVITLPRMPEKDIEKAIHFAAREVVPADIDEMFLGWSRLGELPHMDSGAEESNSQNEAAAVSKVAAPVGKVADDTTDVPIFITAAPKTIVERYTKLMAAAKLELVALEVETFPLVRSLLTSTTDSAMIVDIGDQATTFHVIDKGTPVLSNTIEWGGKNITEAVAVAAGMSVEAADQYKQQHGLHGGANEAAVLASERAVTKLVDQAKRIMSLDQGYAISRSRKTVLIGGGAKLKGLAEFWTKGVGHLAFVGNPWRGLTYPPELEPRLSELGPTYAVAVGLAHRQLVSSTTNPV